MSAVATQAAAQVASSSVSDSVGSLVGDVAGSVTTQLLSSLLQDAVSGTAADGRVSLNATDGSVIVGGQLTAGTDTSTQSNVLCGLVDSVVNPALAAAMTINSDPEKKYAKFIVFLLLNTQIGENQGLGPPTLVVENRPHPDAENYPGMVRVEAFAQIREAVDEFCQGDTMCLPPFANLVVVLVQQWPELGW